MKNISSDLHAQVLPGFSAEEQLQATSLSLLLFYWFSYLVLKNYTNYLKIKNQ